MLSITTSLLRQSKREQACRQGQAGRGRACRERACSWACTRRSGPHPRTAHQRRSQSRHRRRCRSQSGCGRREGQHGSRRWWHSRHGPRWHQSQPWRSHPERRRRTRTWRARCTQAACSWAGRERACSWGAGRGRGCRQERRRQEPEQ